MLGTCFFRKEILAALDFLDSADSRSDIQPLDGDSKLVKCRSQWCVRRAHTPETRNDIGFPNVLKVGPTEHIIVAQPFTQVIGFNTVGNVLLRRGII